MIVATAGHVDHGKTSLVKQLTGVDTDTLEEEKMRGLSINLGYAYLPQAHAPPLGFIDVPGHQRFINTMIAGISGVDLGLLVVAADDGVMPQTVEHIDVLDILGVDRIIVVITKIDLTDDLRVNEVDRAVSALLEARRWPGADVFTVSNQDGSGISALKRHLLLRSQQHQGQTHDGGFRLAIDRCFTARGSGLIVTGTASMGRVNVGDTLQVLPSHKAVRIRGLRAENQAVTAAGAGQRVALNLSGKVEVSTVQRGNWLVDPAFATLSTRLDVSFSLRAGAPFALKHLSPVKLHLGASRTAGRLALLNCVQRRLPPGDNCIAQLVLERPVSAVHGERFLLRDHAENVILGGGVVLDPNGPRYGKARRHRLTWLHAMQAPSTEEALAQLLASRAVVDLSRFWAMRNCPTPVEDTLLPAGTRTFGSGDRQWAATAQQWQATQQLMMELIRQWHEDQPEQPGIRMTELKSQISRDIEPALAMAVLVDSIQRGEVALSDGYISRRGFSSKVSGQARDDWATLQRFLQRRGLQIPLRSEMPAGTRLAEPVLKAIIKQAVRRGDLHRLNDNRYALPEHLLQFSERIIAADREGAELSVIALKSRFESGRKLTVELLEYFDSIRFTQRQGDSRIILDAAGARAQLQRATRM